MLSKAARTVLFWCYLFVIFSLGFAAAALVHESAPAWELPLAGVGFLLAIFGFIGWLRVPKRRRWLPEGLTWIGLVAAIGFAVFHGWGGVVQVVLVLCALACVVAVIVFQVRLFRRVFPVPPELALEASQPITPEARDDDPDVVALYPVRSKLMRSALIGLPASALFGLIPVVAWTHPAWEGSGLMVVLGGVMVLLIIAAYMSTIARIVRPQPLVVLRRDGIVVNTLLTHVGLVRWREIVGTFIQGPGSYRFRLSRRMLVVMVANPGVVRARQPILNRALLRLLTLGESSPVLIPEQALPMPLEELEEMMRPYLERAHGESWVPDVG